MPMKLEIDGSKLHVRQSFDAPAVYLDHWALCELSEDQGLRYRFVRALRAKRGTLLLSHTNLGEFTVPTDIRHATAAEELLDLLLPNVYLSDLDLEKALAAESDPDLGCRPRFTSVASPAGSRA